jgi:hypothetical protein
VTFYVLHSITRNTMMEGWVAGVDRLVLKVQYNSILLQEFRVPFSLFENS